MAGFYFRLEREDGHQPTPSFCTRRYRTGAAATTIPLGADRMLRVVETRFMNEDPVLVVEPAKSYRRTTVSVTG